MPALSSLAFASLALLASQSEAPSGSGVAWTSVEESSLTRVVGGRWMHDLSEFELLAVNREEWSRPYISADRVRVFAATRNGSLGAWDLATGEELWRKTKLGVLGLGMAEFRGHLLVGIGTRLVALDQQLGREKWSVPISGSVGGEITITGTVAIVPVRPNAFLAVDLKTQTVAWRAKRPAPEGLTVRGQASATIDRRRGCAYLGFSDGVVQAVGLADGEALWSKSLAKPGEFFGDVDTAPVLASDQASIIVASYSGGTYRLGADDGRVIWKNADLTAITHLLGVRDQGLVVASHGEGQVVALYEDSGRIRWRYKLKKGAPARPINLGASRVLIAGSEGPAAVLNVSDGRPIQLLDAGSGSVSAPAFRDPDLVFLTNAGRLLATRHGGGGFVDF